MNVWEKIRDELQKGAEKTGELVKDGAELAYTRVSYATKLAQLNWELRNIQKSINDGYTELGGLLFELHSKNRLSDLEKEAKPLFEKLAALEKDFESHEQQKNDLPKTYGFETIDKQTVKDLRNDLEEGGGTIVQVTLESDSPFSGKKLKEIALPKEALIGTIVRDEKVVIPDGETVFQPGDKVTVLGKREDVEAAIEQMTSGKIQD